MLKTLPPWRMVAFGCSVGVLAGLLAVSFELDFPGQICEYNQATNHEDCTTYSLFPFLFIQVFNTLNYYGVAITGIATVLLAFITAGLVYVARAQIKTTRAQLRAYVFFEQGHIKLVTSKGQQFIAAEVRFKNFGQTPAYKFKSWVGIHLCESSTTPFEGDPDGADGAIESVIGPGGAIDSNVFRPTPLLPSDVDDIKNGVKTIFLWGQLNYLDAFKEPQSYSFYSRNGDEVPGVGWSIRTSTKPHEAT